MKIIHSSRRRHYVARVSIFLITAALIAGMVGCGDYTPTPRNLEIRTWYDLADVRYNLDDNHTLMNDLDSTTAGYAELAGPTANRGMGWKPIKFSSYRFTGTFDGQGYEIRDLFINRVDGTPENIGCVGLFGMVGTGGRIENIGVVNATVTGFSYVGGLVGENRGTVSNSYFTGSVTGGSLVGGLVGRDYGGTVSNSYFTGNVNGYRSVGGLVGSRYGSTVSNSHYNYDEVLIEGESIITVGALFGEDFDQWLANDKFLDVNERLSQENGYYVVNNLTDFKELLAFGQNDTLKFRLTNDLDLDDEPNFYIPYLAGEFDGNGHKISNLSLDFDFVDVGLFGYLAPGGKVTQVGVENINITGDADVGGLVGENRGTVSNCYATGSVTGSATTPERSYEEHVGGLVGDNYQGTVSNSYFTGSVSGLRSVGGLVGRNYGGTVSNSYSTGSVSGTDHVGGLVGWNSLGLTWSTVSNSYSTGNVNGSRSVGGLVGTNYGSVSNSYSTGNVNGSRSIGGLVGGNSDTVSYSYSTGNVIGNEQVGGLVGWNNIGGTVGISFWGTETSGQATSDGGTGKTTAEMQNIATFSWNIIAVAPGSTNTTRIWNIVNGVTYPFLSWQP